MLAPSLASIGYVDEVIRAAGPRATRDRLRSAPPTVLAARLGGLFRNVAPARRGYALLGTTGAGFLVVLLLLLLLARG